MLAPEGTIVIRTLHRERDEKLQPEEKVRYGPPEQKGQRWPPNSLVATIGANHSTARDGRYRGANEECELGQLDGLVTIGQRR